MSQRTSHLIITLNGTDENPWEKCGLKQNPFPQLGWWESGPGEQRLAGLDGDPIPNTAYIRSHLAGYISNELIDLCCQMFKKGERIRFRVEF